VSILGCLFACTLGLVQAQSSLRSGAARLTTRQVQDQFQSELMALLGHGDAASTARLERFQTQLRPMYLALPKSADGSLDDGATRYALHRFFAQQHGWHVKGLEATGAEKWGDAASTTMLEDHIPSYILQLFKQKGGWTGLRELAVLAATIEDLVHSEAIQLLTSAYVAQGVSLEQSLAGDAERRVVETYLLFHIMPSPKYAALSVQALNSLLPKVPKFYTGWEDTLLWLQDLQGAMDYEEFSRQNPFKAGDVSTRSRDFNSVTNLIEVFGERYGQFQNLECRAMKNTLIDLSDGFGRVRLSKFYSAAFENSSKTSQHFSESPEYLRHLGVLDETDSQQPSVIVTNYMYSRANCMASSSLYSICCIDECEAIMTRLEQSIASSAAKPQVIAELVSATASDTVSAPRVLAAPLRNRLDDIANRHGGRIPIHGRLFAQWMHHAFPNECPFPHVSGSLASPLTPSAWMHADGEVKRRIKASKEEMQTVIEADVNASTPETEYTFASLPWTEEEELMVGSIVAHPMGSASALLRLATLLLLVTSVTVGLLRMLSAAPASVLPVSSARVGKRACWSICAGEQRSQFI